MKHRRPAPPDHAATKDTIEFHVDTCGYSDNIMRATELLKSFYDRTQIKRLEYVTTEQSMRELANASTKEMLLTSRIATGYLRGGDKKPDSKFAQFVARNRDWVTVYRTPHCEHFHRVLIEVALPQTIVPIYRTVTDLHRKLTQGIPISDYEWTRWQDMMDSFKLKIEPSTEAKQDPENLVRVYHSTFEQLQGYAFEMMYQDGALHSVRHAQELPIINETNGWIDNPYMIQSMRVQNALWKPVAAQDILRHTHHDCADRAIVSYFTRDFSDKPDADQRILVVVTDDVGLRREFADVVTGIHLHSNGREKTVLTAQDYEKSHYIKRDRYPDVLICSSITIRHFFEHRLNDLQALAANDVSLQPMLRELNNVIVGIRQDAKFKFGQDERSQGLLRSFDGMRIHRQSDKVPHRKPRRSEDGGGGMTLH